MKITKQYLKQLIMEAIQAEGVKVSVSGDPREPSWLEDSEEHSKNLGAKAYVTYKENMKPNKLETYFHNIARKENGAYTLYHLDVDKFTEGYVSGFMLKYSKGNPETIKATIADMVQKVKNKVLANYPDASKKPQKRKQVGSRAGERGGWEEPIYDGEEDFDK